MIDCRFRPLHQWPRKLTTDRRNGTFRSSYSETLKLLEFELDKLDAININIQLALRPQDIRNDGWPRSNAREPEHPGVIVSFDSSRGPLSFACDTYWDWKDNLRAIALTLENLRAVERYGATKHGEQYRGYAAIPAREADDFESADDAARWLATVIANGSNPEQIINSLEAFTAAYRNAAAKLHPDTGGSTEAFQKLQHAKDMIEKSQGR